jgi:hypothetical protein
MSFEKKTLDLTDEQNVDKNMFAVLILSLVLILSPSTAFAQQYLTVKPPFAIYGGDYDVCENSPISIDTPSDLNSNYTRTTVVDYDGTKLVSTLVLGRISTNLFLQQQIVKCLTRFVLKIKKESKSSSFLGEKFTSYLFQKLDSSTLIQTNFTIAT